MIPSRCGTTPVGRQPSDDLRSGLDDQLIGAVLAHDVPGRLEASQSRLCSGVRTRLLIPRLGSKLREARGADQPPVGDHDDLVGDQLDLCEHVARHEHPCGPSSASSRRKPGHQPAAHTILNFPVDDIETAVAELGAAGVQFEHYDSGPIKTDARGIATPGPKQAWFRDPAGNILSIIEE